MVTEFTTTRITEPNDKAYWWKYHEQVCIGSGLAAEREEYQVNTLL